jgi:hypothetical protein
MIFCILFDNLVNEHRRLKDGKPKFNFLHRIEGGNRTQHLFGYQRHFWDLKKIEFDLRNILQFKTTYCDHFDDNNLNLIVSNVPFTYYKQIIIITSIQILSCNCS